MGTTPCGGGTGSDILSGGAGVDTYHFALGQNREIAVFKPWDPKAFTANASFVMNAMPWKGQTLFTDFNSGLWAAKLEPRTPVVP